MADRSPMVRVAASRDTLAFVDKTVPGAGAEILGRFPKESLDVWEGASRTGWLPIEHDHFMVDCTLEVLGQQKAAEVWRASVASIIERPFLKTFISGMLAIFGDDRDRVVGLFPRAFGQVYRDFGEIRLKRDAREARVIMTNVADSVWEHPGYFETWRAAALGTLDVARLQGSANVLTESDSRTVEIVFRW